MTLFPADAPPELQGLFLVSAALFGACLGSFSSAVAHRTAAGESWIFKKRQQSKEPARSSCPHCHTQLKFFDLIPLFSWIFLRGQCRYCGHPIGRRYVLFEAVCSCLAVLLCLQVRGDWLSLGILLMCLPFLTAAVFLVFRKKPVPTYMWGAVFLYAVMSVKTMLPFFE